jgi:hypothetical protein
VVPVAVLAAECSSMTVCYGLAKVACMHHHLHVYHCNVCLRSILCLHMSPAAAAVAGAMRAQLTPVCAAGTAAAAAFLHADGERWQSTLCC